ncbi:hypothetical protein [Pseudomonas phage UF_RH7]|nr:hypothetical protein [Pseudomonas phage UF_RH7]
MKQFYANIPGVAHALKVFGRDEKEARQRLRDREGYGDRLPAGTKLYPVEGVK